MQQSPQPTYNQQEHQRRQLRFISSSAPGTPSSNHSMPFQQTAGPTFQGKWSRKRGLYSDSEESPTIKRRQTNSRSGLFGWSDLLAATTHSPGASLSQFHVETHDEYFDQHLSLHSNPVTPPMDPGLSPLAPSFPRFQLSGYQQSHSHSSWGECEQEKGYFQLSNTNSAFDRACMDMTDLTNQREPCYGSYDQRPNDASQIQAFRSLSPAPSSPSDSINDLEGNSGMQDADGYVASMISHPHINSKNRSRAALIQDKRGSNSRVQFVMGFRADCEKCQRREKGHYAHFN